MSAKTLYLASPVVAQFVTWLGEHLDTATFAHAYTNRLTQAPWHCESLFDAYRKYDWRQPTLPGLPAGGSSFAANAATLDALSGALRSALGPRPNDAAACAAATNVMAWGGVMPGNVRWLNMNEPALAALLLTVKAALDSHALGGGVLRNPDLRFNAGMTKVYSLICDGLIIYDSRVAAALGWAVTLFCQAQGLGTVPPELNFPWAPAKASPNQRNPKRRDPSLGTLGFQKLTPGPRHAEWNLKASWVLEAALACPAGQQSAFGQDPALPTPALRLRAVEAALFMIGYDLGGGVVAVKMPAPCTLDATLTLTLTRRLMATGLTAGPRHKRNISATPLPPRVFRFKGGLTSASRRSMPRWRYCGVISLARRSRSPTTWPMCRLARRQWALVGLTGR